MGNAREVRVGDHVRDNDPRSDYRTRVVVAISSEGRAQLRHPRITEIPSTWVRLDRIYTDGKPRRTGWSVVP